MATDSTDNAVTESQQETRAQANRRIYAALPPLQSDEFLQLVRNALEHELPAEVLVRAYRELGMIGPTADAILVRLVGKTEVYSYMRPLLHLARKWVRDSDWFDANELYGQAISTVGMALAGPQGEGADSAWISFLAQRLRDTYRELNGRRNERADPPRADPATGTSGSDFADRTDAQHAPWHGRVDPDVCEWLEAFTRRTMATIRDDNIRAVGLDQFCGERTPIDGPTGLAAKFGVTRDRVIRWRDAARAKLLAALKTQNERELDLAWLEGFRSRAEGN